VLLLQARYGDARVVVDAEAARPRAQGVVQATGDAHGVGSLPAPPGLLDHAHVGQAVDGREVLVGRALRRDEGVSLQETQRLAELEGEPDAEGIEGMVPAEPVGFERQIVDNGRPTTHGLGGQRTV
jgi:hypothetical protein